MNMVLVKDMIVLLVATLLMKGSGAMVIDQDLFSSNEEVIGEVLNVNSNIGVGSGYSQDSQQVAAQRCYNTSISSTSGQKSFVQLDTAMSFSDLQNSLKISVDVRASFGMFSADAQSSYMRSIEDKEYSLSLNYYQYANSDVSLQLAGSGTDALTKTGKEFYKNGKNPYFGIMCGDNYITSYKQGALLTMSLVIQFSSSDMKQAFQETVSASFGSLVSASETVKTFVDKYKTSGSVVIQAFQVGGEPSQLSKILNEDSEKKFNALTCSLSAIDDCVKAASDLLNYARNEFTTQYSFQNNTGLSPLGIGFTEYASIKYLGLTPPQSLVTKQVSTYRDQLSTILKENQYYQQKLYPFLNKGYPVSMFDGFVTKVNSILTKVTNNINLLMQVHNGAADCFNFPDKCKSTMDSLNSQIVNITASDLKFLEPLRYKIGTFGGELYNTGESYNTWSVKYTWDNIEKEVKNVYNVVLLYSKYFFMIDTVHHGSLKFVSSTRDGITYIGGAVDNKGNFQCTITFVREISPFYFQLYNGTSVHKNTPVNIPQRLDSSLPSCQSKFS